MREMASTMPAGDRCMRAHEQIGMNGKWIGIQFLYVTDTSGAHTTHTHVCLNLGSPAILNARNQYIYISGVGPANGGPPARPYCTHVSSPRFLL